MRARKAESEAIAKAALRRLLVAGEARSIRMRAGVSQADVAHSIYHDDGSAATPGAVSHWETGRRIPKGGLALQYLALLMELAEDER